MKDIRPFSNVLESRLGCPWLTEMCQPSYSYIPNELQFQLGTLQKFLTGSGITNLPENTIALLCLEAEM